MTEFIDQTHVKDVNEWEASIKISPEVLATAKKILLKVMKGADVYETIRKYPVPNHGNISKHALVTAYKDMISKGEIAEDSKLLSRIRMKPMRTLSGVTTVTVLTGPYPCPGNCIFCPTDIRMPKSYLPDEPGAARAFQNHFDPYEQVLSRIKTYEAVGHPTDKIELLILGGSWTNYPQSYQTWFVQRCLDAMNGCDSENIQSAQMINETAAHRNVGLVIETRPDLINPEILKFLRILGVTKIQIGIQSLNDDILLSNRRGHTVAEALSATALCRAAGYKIVLHWMPNLLHATPESDREDFRKFWIQAENGLGFCPDELKIYPTQLLINTDLYKEWEKGLYQPYDTETLIQLIADIKATVQPYCRINRVIRDIPSHHIVEGNTRSSLRMDVQKRMNLLGTKCKCIRCREIKGQAIKPEKLQLIDFQYAPAYSHEHFLQFVTDQDKIAGYLRLSLPAKNAPQTGIAELENAALIREIHIYGQSLAVGSEQTGAAQHMGLGTRLIESACEIARQEGFQKIAVISAIGTRRYYQSRGFSRGDYYMIRLLNKSYDEQKG
ncbi:elongator complex protein 3 [Flexilinea flocculi]|uniref:tRNA carboxymethyluridine synthase n=1 Tax=Flexilinea flocculi TaxID=1678840 RepID=A0A0S7BXR7_9CHLR|nr:elongator complex protein 3 [Flexilinea flocculi]NMB93894.1 tRNA uridine(34) 5-carboxymethylaminomethyl modification radical SAM/GNAT enzyme Elp3 [Flexilinea flocculi]GAP41432.1 radical SAM enzyme [Flexilinea flocculi]